VSPSAEESRLSLRSYAAAQEVHSHPHHQIVLPLEGRLEMETDIAGAAVDETTAAVITAGREHAFRARGDNRFLVLDVPRQGCAAAAELWDLAADAPFLGLDEGLRGLLLFARSRPSDAHAPAEFRSSLGNLILQGLTHRARGAGSGEPEALRRATAFIRRHYATPLTTREIAAAAGVSPATLQRLFAAWHGRGPAGYLGGLRLERAKALLATTRKPVAEIALDCGYSEQSALTRALRREAGVSPARFRRDRGCHR